MNIRRNKSETMVEKVFKVFSDLVLCKGLSVINIFLVRGADASSNSTKDDKATNTFFTDDMITGLCAGFGFFAGLLFFICLIWCFCCGDGCGKDNNKKRKVGPAKPPWKSRDESRAESRVTTANTSSTRVPSSTSARRT